MVHRLRAIRAIFRALATFSVDDGTELKPVTTSQLTDRIGGLTQQFQRLKQQGFFFADDMIVVQHTMHQFLDH